MASPAISQNLSGQSQHSGSGELQLLGTEPSQHSGSGQSQHSGTAQMQLTGLGESQHSASGHSQLSSSGQLGLQLSGSQHSRHSVSGESQHSGSRHSSHSASGKLQNSCSSTVHHTALSVMSSVLRHVSQFVQDREILQDTLSLHSNMTFLSGDALVNFAAELVDEIVSGALLILGQRDEEYMIMNSKMYPKTKEAIDSYPSIFEMAYEFIDTILNQLRNRVDHMRLLGIERFQNYSSVSDFKVKDGLELIVKCITQWSYNPHWYFEIIYNGAQISDSHPDSHCYYYTVRWSVPSLSYPVAQVTVDVYFLIEVFNMSPPPVHIEVGYRLETDRSVRCALTTPFIEKWLNTIVKRKLETLKMFKF